MAPNDDSTTWPLPFRFTQNTLSPERMDLKPCQPRSMSMPSSQARNELPCTIRFSLSRLMVVMSPARVVPSQSSPLPPSGSKWLRNRDSPATMRLSALSRPPLPFLWVEVVMFMLPLMAIMAPDSVVQVSPSARLILAAVLPGRLISSICMAGSSGQTRVDPAGDAGNAAGLNHDFAFAHHAGDQALATEQAGENPARQLQFQFDARFVGPQVAGVDDVLAVDFLFQQRTKRAVPDLAAAAHRDAEQAFPRQPGNETGKGDADFHARRAGQERARLHVQSIAVEFDTAHVAGRGLHQGQAVGQVGGIAEIVDEQIG